jgi:serine/threonine-protein kinase RsbW
MNNTSAQDSPQGSRTHVLSFASSTSNMRLVEPFIGEVLRETVMDATRYHNMMIALTEAVNNAIVHGNRRDESKTVTLTATLDDTRIKLVLDDAGSGFNPDGLPDPLAPENLLRDGGRGVFLMRSLMDSAEFTTHEYGSRVKLVTRLRDDSEDAQDGDDGDDRGGS